MAAAPPTLTAENAHEFWSQAWQADRTGWRGGEKTHPFFRNMYVFLASMTPEKAKGVAPLPYDARPLGENGNDIFNGPEEQAAVKAYLSGKCVLVPLCGDTPAIPFFAAQGASMVVGADLSAQGLAAQRENNFPGVNFTTTVVRGAEADAKAEDKVLLHEATLSNGCVVRLFEGDFLRLTEVPAFTAAKADFVYDRASFMAMNPALRGPYVRVVAGQMGAATPLLVERPVRKEGDARGPPFTFTNEDVQGPYEKELGRSLKVETILMFKWTTAVEGPLHFEFISVLPKTA